MLSREAATDIQTPVLEVALLIHVAPLSVLVMSLPASPTTTQVLPTEAAARKVVDTSSAGKVAELRAQTLPSALVNKVPPSPSATQLPLAR